MTLPRYPVQARDRRRRERRARPGLRRHRGPAAHRRVRVGSPEHAVLAGRGDPAAAPAGVLHVRGGAVHPGRLAGAGRLGRGRHLRLHPRPDSLQVSITDAVGHQVSAALLATLLVGGLRNGRRKGLDLAGQAAYANDCLAENAAPGQFVTGQLLRVDLHDRHGRHRQRRAPVPAAPPRRPGRGDRAAHRAAVRGRPRQVLRRPAVPARAGRPDRPAHRRHAGAQRRRPRRRSGAGRTAPTCTRARSSRNWAPRS